MFHFKAIINSLTVKRDMTSEVVIYPSLVLLFLLCCGLHVSEAQDPNAPPAVPLEAENCIGVFISYDFQTRRKEFPHLKNTTAQSWAFNATATVLNTDTVMVMGWKLFIGFQHNEILVSAGGANLFDGSEFPASVANGSYLVGTALPDLETSINTAGDLSQIQAKVHLVGTQFGVKPPAFPMPKKITLINHGYRCPQSTFRKTSMWACCKRDPKFKPSESNTKLWPRQKGDLTISYDVLQVYVNNYQVQVSMENHNPFGRLDRWNMTWEWTRGEFISNMKGAFTRDIDYSGCVYGPAGEYYTDMDFSKVLNCQKNPIISDLPIEKYNNSDIGKIPYCCRNGSLLPIIMDPSQSKSVFLMQVFKIPPDLNRTSIFPPQKWKVTGILNPDYECGQPLRVKPSEFPDTEGLDASVIAIASWEIACNITKPRKTRCCVSFSAYYNESVVPCNTCACGCKTTHHCNPNANAMLLPSEALLVPFHNRTMKTVAWAKLKHFEVPNKLPCGDNCGVSINWHIVSDYKGGWSARITLFNWETVNFVDWFTALQFQNKRVSLGFERVFSFNGSMLPLLNHTIFMQGLPGINYLMGEDNTTDPYVPGKQQSVISFSKKHQPAIKIANGDGFPSRVFFNGEECSIPIQFPVQGGNRHNVDLHLLHTILVLVLDFTTNQIL